MEKKRAHFRVRRLCKVGKDWQDTAESISHKLEVTWLYGIPPSQRWHAMQEGARAGLDTHAASNVEVINSMIAR